MNTARLSVGCIGANFRWLERLREFELNWPTDPTTRPLYGTTY